VHAPRFKHDHAKPRQTIPQWLAAALEKMLLCQFSWNTNIVRTHDHPTLNNYAKRADGSARKSFIDLCLRASN
jgi:hypothetical protein